MKVTCINVFSAFSVTKEDTTNKESLLFPDYNDATFSTNSGTDSFVVPTVSGSDEGEDKSIEI